MVNPARAAAPRARTPATISSRPSATALRTKISLDTTGASATARWRSRGVGPGVGGARLRRGRGAGGEPAEQGRLFGGGQWAGGAAHVRHVIVRHVVAGAFPDLLGRAA